MYHQSGNEIRQSRCLERRGPDAVRCQYASLSSQLRGYACGCVLWMRGDTCTSQPVVTARGDIFLWNGNVFGGHEIPANQSDTEYLADMLAACDSAEAVCAVMSRVRGPFAFILWHAATRCLWLGRDYFGRRSLLWNAGTHQRSNCLILSSVSVDNTEHQLNEVPCSGLFSIHIPVDSTSLTDTSICVYPWSHPVDPQRDLPLHCSVAPSIKIEPPVDTRLNRNEPVFDSVECRKVSLAECSEQPELVAMRQRFECVLMEAVRRRVYNAPRLCRDCVGKQRNGSRRGIRMDAHSSIDETCANNDGNRMSAISGDDRTSANTGSDKIQTQSSTNGTCANNGGNRTGGNNDGARTGVNNGGDMTGAISGDDRTGGNHAVDRTCANNGGTRMSAKNRAETTISNNDPCFTSSPSVCQHARLAVLFSGGVDSAVLAAMAHRCLTDLTESSNTVSDHHNSRVVIDLLNVAFVDKKSQTSVPGSSHASSHSSGAACVDVKAGKGCVARCSDECTATSATTDGAKGVTRYGSDSTTTTTATNAGSNGVIVADGVPDRVAGLACWHQLQQIYPQTTWNFVQIDVTADELSFWRENIISRLISPQDSIIDDSIGCALWFAARGSGVLAGTNEAYSSPARVVLVGMGADEQLAGYGRHRAAFVANSWNGLNDEIAKQLADISHRNLGRDDRVVSYHGVEARYPYLDEAVVECLCAEPVWLKARLSSACTRHALAADGIDKLPVRLLALHCQLAASAALTKRAIQFGSRIAKVSRARDQRATTTTTSAAAAARGDVVSDAVVAPTLKRTEHEELRSNDSSQ